MARRLMAFAAALLVIIVGWLALDTSAEQAPKKVPAAAAYGYDPPSSSYPSTSDTSERGPPAAEGKLIGNSADGMVPLGVSTRPDDGTSPAIYRYDDSHRFVRIASGSSELGRHLGAPVAETRLLLPGLLAAGPRFDLQRVQQR